MNEIINYIYSTIGILALLYFYITRKDFRKKILMLLLALAAFVGSSYLFYFLDFPFNLIGTYLVLILWAIIIVLVKSHFTKREIYFWFFCSGYVAIHHVLHFIFEPMAERNIWYALIFVLYSNVGIVGLTLYYLFKINKSR